MFQPSEDLPGAMDDVGVVYAMAREGRVPHLYRGDIPPSGFIHRLAVCQRVIVDRVAVPSDTAAGRICRWCERAEEAQSEFPSGDREVHESHDPEPDGVRLYQGGQACRRCLRFVSFEGVAYQVTDAGVAPCQRATLPSRG
jgi:hypothetical protein